VLGKQKNSDDATHAKKNVVHLIFYYIGRPHVHVSSLVTLIVSLKFHKQNLLLLF